MYAQRLCLMCFESRADLCCPSKVARDEHINSNRNFKVRTLAYLA